MKAKGISRLSHLRKDELIKEIRNIQFEINKLKKELKNQSFKWMEYYRHKEYDKMKAKNKNKNE